MRIPALIVLLPVIGLAGAAQAADWTAVKLHGMVYADAGGGNWVRLARGSAIADGRAIRTLASGNAVFARGAETVAFGPDTVGEITDRPGRQPFTIVVEQAGTVAVSAEARAVRHFSVETPYLVAVVKGTQFTVRTTAAGSDVAVSRGLVSVTTRAGSRTVLLPAGQSVSTTPFGGMLVSGAAIPSLVHPRIGGVVEDAADPGQGGAAAISDPTGLGGTVSGIGRALGGTVTAVGDTAGAAITGIGTVAEGTTDTLGGTLGGLGASAGPLGSVGSTAGATIGAAGTAVRGLASTAGSTAATAGGVAGGAVSGLTGTVGGAVGGVAGSAGSVSGEAAGLLGHLGL